MRKSTKVFIVSIIGFLAISAFAFMILIGGPKELIVFFRPISTDEELMANFQANRLKFYQLRNMLKEDQNLFYLSAKIICLGPIETYFCGSDSEIISETHQTNTRISLKRIGQYRDLLDDLSLIRIDVEPDRKGFVLTSFAENFFSVHSKTKGYKYIEGNPEYISYDIKPSLDELHESPGYRTGIREIGENWYIYFQAY